MSKQTALQWLEIALISEPYSEEDFEHNKRCWKQALQMEREQIENTARYYFHEHGRLTAGQYYEQTYGGQ